MSLQLERGSLIVSCQAREDNPLHGPVFMAAMALAARDGGARGIRANGPDDVRAVKAAGLPVIGIHKIFSGDVPVYISDCAALLERTDWRRQRGPERILADIGDWIRADEERLAATLGLDGEQAG